MARLEGFSDGERCFVSFAYIEDNGGEPRASAWVHEATVFSAEHGLVVRDGGDGTPKATTCGETVHRTAEQAWRRCAAELRVAAAVVGAKASECDVRSRVGEAVPS